MSSILTSTSPPDFLTNFYSALPPVDGRRHRRPRVTLTFAQSLDSKIAGKGGEQLILSGKESMIMTHWMRTMHDAIMVGIGTALNDNPQLNTRHLPPREPDASQGHGRAYHLPRPIILDTNLRLKTDCKLIQNYKNGSGRRPWVICAAQSSSDDAGFKSRMKLLTDLGVQVIRVLAEQGRIDIQAMLRALSELGVRSLMVEGGASVIKSFFTGVSNPNENFVDAAIVTVAPVFVGQQGIGYDLNIQNSTGLQHVHSEVLGKDAVLMLKSGSYIRLPKH